MRIGPTLGGSCRALAAAVFSTIAFSSADAQSLEPTRESEAIEFLTNGVPERFEPLQELKRHRPEEYWEELQRALLERADLERAKREDPERHRLIVRERALDARSFTLARRLRNGEEGATREGLVRELESVLGELFDLRESLRQEEIERLELELAELREQGEQRRRHRDLIVQRRIEELIGLAELYAW